MVHLCGRCNNQKAALRRPKTSEQLCRDCFYEVFEEEVHQTIVGNKLFKSGEKVAIGASGGKDSTVLAHLLTLLNKRHSYGLQLFLLSIDEGITGYRDDSLETVKRNEQQYQIPLEVVSYKQLYGWTMDDIVKEIGTKNNCTFCGVFRRQALDRGATMMRADKIATGHNADDIAETVLLNILRGDLPRLSRCAAIITGEDGELPRVKPFKYTYQKEIVMYAYFKKLDYFSTECIYAPFAARGLARDFVKDLEATRPRAIVDLIHSAETFRIELGSEGNLPQPKKCERCGYICSQAVCKACQLLEGLNKGLPSMGISRPGQVKSRTAAKVASDKLHALSVDEDRERLGQMACDNGKVSCQCARGSSAASAQCQHDDSQRAALNQDAGRTVHQCTAQSNGNHCSSTRDMPQAQQNSPEADGQSCGADGECANASAQMNGVLCASNEDWTLPSNISETNDVSVAQSSSPVENDVPAAHVDSVCLMQRPIRVHGKLYESNLREVDAHPSARRPARADFGTSW